ncbi:acidic phospholipase A2 PA4-like [Oppia nitens]|uniref:acidic phospholipase A2 PA4-like n=1 Tax=Oppia nitens TaxID=1686743 RepID=UPI0023DC3804|nr:acidic phospholipase A2 PA4-like [Oppia nitens]
MFPNTKWCGPGNTARNYNDLGSDAATDACCRQHDNCNPPGVRSGHLQYLCQLPNTQFQISSCDCDRQFGHCLSRLGSKSLTATLVAKIYRTFVTNCIAYNPYTQQCRLIDRVF